MYTHLPFGIALEVFQNVMAHWFEDIEGIEVMPFNSFKFKKFTSNWEIEVATSNSHYLKSNGLVERMFRLLNRC